jgi:hypothetical protein
VRVRCSSSTAGASATRHLCTPACYSMLSTRAVKLRQYVALKGHPPPLLYDGQLQEVGSRQFNSRHVLYGFHHGLRRFL